MPITLATRGIRMVSACGIALAMTIAGAGCSSPQGQDSPAASGQKSRSDEAAASSGPATKEDLDKSADETIAQMEEMAKAFEEKAKNGSGDQEKDLNTYFDAADELSAVISSGVDQLRTMASESHGLDASEQVEKIRKRYEELADKEYDDAVQSGFVDKKELDAMMSGSQQAPAPEDGQAS